MKQDMMDYIDKYIRVLCIFFVRLQLYSSIVFELIVVFSSVFECNIGQCVAAAVANAFDLNVMF